MKSNNKFYNLEYGSKIRYYRTLKGYSLKRLAALLGISAQQLQKYEKGINRITIERLNAICSILDLPLHEFIQTKNSLENIEDKLLKKLIFNYGRIKTPKMRKLLVENAKAFSNI